MSETRSRYRTESADHGSAGAYDYSDAERTRSRYRTESTDHGSSRAHDYSDAERTRSRYRTESKDHGSSRAHDYSDAHGPAGYSGHRDVPARSPTAHRHRNMDELASSGDIYDSIPARSPQNASIVYRDVPSRNMDGLASSGDIYDFFPGRSPRNRRASVVYRDLSSSPEPLPRRYSHQASRRPSQSSGSQNPRASYRDGISPKPFSRPHTHQFPRGPSTSYGSQNPRASEAYRDGGSPPEPVPRRYTHQTPRGSYKGSDPRASYRDGISPEPVPRQHIHQSPRGPSTSYGSQNPRASEAYRDGGSPPEPVPRRYTHQTPRSSFKGSDPRASYRDGISPEPVPRQRTYQTPREPSAGPGSQNFRASEAHRDGGSPHEPVPRHRTQQPPRRPTPGPGSQNPRPQASGAYKHGSSTPEPLPSAYTHHQPPCGHSTTAQKPKVGTLYTTLGVLPSATRDEIMRAGKVRRIAVHPDKLKKPGMSVAEKEKIDKVATDVAYAADILGDEKTREKYDHNVVRGRDYVGGLSRSRSLELRGILSRKVF